MPEDMWRPSEVGMPFARGAFSVDSEIFWVYGGLDIEDHPNDYRKLEA